MYETYHDNLQLSFDPNMEGNWQLHFIGCDSIILSNKTHDFVRHI